MSQEKVLLDAGSGIRVTTARANLGGRTYAMANVTSVNLSRTLADRSLGKWVGILAAIVSMGAAAQGAWGVAMVAALGVALGMWLYQLPKDNYHVVLGSASGESEALTSKDPDFATAVVDALNEAIVLRG